MEVDKKMDYGEKSSDEEMVEAMRLLESEGIIVLFGPSKLKPNFRLAKDLHNIWFMNSFFMIENLYFVA